MQVILAKPTDIKQNQALQVAFLPPRILGSVDKISLYCHFFTTDIKSHLIDDSAVAYNVPETTILTKESLNEIKFWALVFAKGHIHNDDNKVLNPECVIQCSSYENVWTFIYTYEKFKKE